MNFRQMIAVFPLALVWQGQMQAQDIADSANNTLGHEYGQSAFHAGLPMEYEGEGFSFVIETIDSNCSTAKGKLITPGGVAVKYAMQLQASGTTGVGQVRMTNALKSLQAWNRGSGRADVAFDGRRYQLEIRQLQKQNTYSERRRRSDEIHKKAMALMTAGDDLEEVDEVAEARDKAPTPPATATSSSEASQEINRMMQEMQRNQSTMEQQNRDTRQKIQQMSKEIAARDAQRLASSWCVNPRIAEATIYPGDT